MREEHMENSSKCKLVQCLNFTLAILLYICSVIIIKVTIERFHRVSIDCMHL